jgi:hypothetical protein
MPEYKCALCSDTFQFGPHTYDGEYIPNYNITVCRTSVQSNRDGIAPVYEEQFEIHLKANNISLPQRNAKGWYPLK